MEQTQSDNLTSSMLTPIDNNIIRTHAVGKIKRNKRNRRALFHRRKYDINKRRSQHAAYMSMPRLSQWIDLQADILNNGVNHE